jgi:hypothetical protein
MQFITWLELAVSAISSRLHKVGATVVVHLMDIEGSQAWWGVTLGDRWLRGSNGALTVFDSLPAANLFLRLLKVDRFKIGEHCQRDAGLVWPDHEVFTMGDKCKRCSAQDCPGRQGQDIFQCQQQTQKLLFLSRGKPLSLKGPSSQPALEAS